MPLDPSHFGNPAALAFECPTCGAAPGDVCWGRKDRPTYVHYLHKARQQMLRPPVTREKWHGKANVIRAAMRKAPLPVYERCQGA